MKEEVSNLRHLSKHRVEQYFFLFILNILNMLLMLIQRFHVQEQSNSGYDSIPWQRVPPINQKELLKQMMNEEFKHQSREGPVCE